MWVVGGNLYSIDLKPTSSHNILFPSIFDELDQASKTYVISVGLLVEILFLIMQMLQWRFSFICGADMMIPKRVLDEVGGFNPDFLCIMRKLN